MSQPRRKDPLLIPLIIVLLALGGSMGYYKYYVPAGVAPVLAAKPVTNTHTDEVIINTIDTNNTTGIIATDSLTAAMHLHADSAHATVPQPLAKNRIMDSITSLVQRTDTPPNFTKVVSSSSSSSIASAYTDNSAPAAVPERVVSVSDNPDVVCQVKYSTRSSKLIVYPSSTKWHSIYLIAPITDKKVLARKNIMQPEYEGVNYPTYTGAKLVYKGQKYDVIQVVFPTTVVDAQHPYGIQLQSNPKFLLFGEQKSNWYVYENGRVNRLTPTKDFSLTED